MRDVSSVLFSFSPSQEKLAVYHDGLLMVLAPTFNAGALFHWFYSMFSYVTISGFGTYLTIIDFLEWMQQSIILG